MTVTINILLSVFLVFSGTGYADARPASSPPPSGLVITLDNDILTGISLPPYGTLCMDTPVYGGPDASIYTPLYTLPAGEVVQLREQPEIEPRDWVMIDTARWIPLSAVCEW
jgi:hypothetical protein